MKGRLDTPRIFWLLLLATFPAAPCRAQIVVINPSDDGSVYSKGIVSHAYLQSPIRGTFLLCRNPAMFGACSVARSILHR
jgi:hypothetical protein